MKPLVVSRIGRLVAGLLVLCLGLPSPALALRGAGLEENAAKDEVAQLLRGAGPAELPAAELLEEGQLTDEQWQWVEDHRSTIETVIRRLWRRGWEIPLEGEEGWEDLRQEGYLALARGVVGFDRSHPAPRSRQLQYRKIGDVPHYVERAMIRYLEQTRDPMTNPLWRNALILLQEQASGEQSLAQTLRRRELREALAAALSRLPDDQQQLVQMWFDEKTSRGWAQKFRVREVTARARLLRSLRSLARSPELVAWGEHYGVIPTPPPRERGRVTLRRALQAGPSPDTLSVVMAALQNPSAGARRQAAVALRRWLKDSTGKPLLLAQAGPLMDALVTAMEHAQGPNDGGAVSAARTLEALAAYPEAYPILEQVGPRLEALQVVATGRIRTWIARLLEYSRYQVVLALRERLLDRSERRPLLRTHAAPFVAALVSVVEQGQGWPRDRAAEAAVDLLDFLAVFYREFHPALIQVRSRLEALRAVTTGITQEKITSLLARQEIFYEPSTASSSPAAGLEEEGANPLVEHYRALMTKVGWRSNGWLPNPGSLRTGDRLYQSPDGYVTGRVRDNGEFELTVTRRSDKAHLTIGEATNLHGERILYLERAPEVLDASTVMPDRELLIQSHASTEPLIIGLAYDPSTAQVTLELAPQVQWPTAKRYTFLVEPDPALGSGVDREITIILRPPAAGLEEGRGRVDPREIWLNQEAGRLRRQGHWREALAKLEEALRINPRNPITLTTKASILVQRGRYDDALALTAEALRLRPDNVQTYIVRAQALNGLGRYAETLALTAEALRLRPDNVQTYTVRAQALNGLGRYAETLALTDRALQLDPRGVQTYLLAVHAYHKLGRYREAERFAAPILERPPDDLASLKPLAQLLHDLQKYPEALEAVGRYLAVVPDDAEARGLWDELQRDLAKPAAGLEEGAAAVDMLAARFEERVTSAVRQWVTDSTVINSERLGIIVDGAMPGALTLATGLEELGVPVVVVQPDNGAREIARRFVPGIPVVAGLEDARAVLAERGVTPVVLPATAGMEEVLRRLQELGIWPLGRDLQPLLAAGLEEARLLRAAAQYST